MYKRYFVCPACGHKAKRWFYDGQVLLEVIKESPSICPVCFSKHEIVVMELLPHG